MTTNVQIPSSLAAAIDALVELDVQKWGEGERQASRDMHRRNLISYGLALNALARRPEYEYGDLVPHLVDAANAALTAADRAHLRL